MMIYLKLMRFHKPIGIFLLLWPTMWALWIAGNGHPSIKNIIIFVCGVIGMRAAGCVINDVVDRRWDSEVARTKLRPLAIQEISVNNALILFFGLCMLSFLLVLQTNAYTIALSFAALGVAILYPFTKRFLACPQLILGIAFSFSVPMAFAAQTNHVSGKALLILLITVLWTIAYDTQYAITDRADDIRIGIKSTAILFGRYDRLIIAILHLTVLYLFYLLGKENHFSWIYFCSIAGAGILFLYQHYLLLRNHSGDAFRAFLNNQWVGLVVFLGIVLSLQG